MTSLPATINVSKARLPTNYEAARQAITTCNNIDECKDWADKAEALASYAKQADDDTLRRLADRIQARAVRRCGELLKTFDSQGKRTDKLPVGDHNKLTTSQAARQAGLSAHQQATAVRVANVPSEKFERAVESDRPATVTKLAAMGKQTRIPAPPEGFKEASKLIGSVRRFAEFCDGHKAEFVAGGVLPSEAAEIRKLVSTIDGWLDRFVVNLGKAA